MPAAIEHPVANREAARLMIDSIQGQISFVQRSTFLTPKVAQRGTFEDPEWRLVCPWCKSDIPTEDGIVEVDVSIRHNRGEVIFDDDHEGGVVSISQSDSHFDTMYLFAACCEMPIDLPDGWDSSWD